MNDDAPTHKAKRPRSPNYPGIDLEAALKRARTLFEHEQRNWTPIPTILSHWGYSHNSGGGLSAISALKKFGLVDDQGSGGNRTGRLSDLGASILLDERDGSQERQAAIQRAALLPPIHKELWHEYAGNLPSDANLRYTLQKDRHFTPGGVAEFLNQFRRTLKFASLTADTATVSEHGQEEQPSNDQEPDLTPPVLTPPATPPAPPLPLDDRPEVRTVQLPLPDTVWATLQVPYPMTDESWDQMLQTLNTMKSALVPRAMKPGLVKDATDK